MKTLEEEWSSILRQQVESGEISGANLLLIRKGEEICRISGGYSNREAQIKTKFDTIYRLYSMTKPVTAVAAMCLAERGTLDILAPVSKYLPAFRNEMVGCADGVEPAKRKMLVRDLLMMTSGLTYGDDETVTELAVRKLFDEVEESLYTDQPITTAEFAERAGAIPLLFSPGDSWKYGISADILGAVIEAAAQKSFGACLEEQIFRPLGMKDTGFYVPEEKQSRLAAAYEKNEEGSMVPYLGDFLGIRNRMDRPAAYESGGAGLVSTIEDYARFAGMLMEKGTYRGVRILKPESIEQMQTAGLNKCQQTAFDRWFGQKGYGYSWLMRSLREPGLLALPGIKGEYCWDGWLGCCFVNYPSEQMTLLVMQQQKSGGDLVARVREALMHHTQFI